jgi:NTP pyrophosphatase (non-canonical NTP hydrolase)
VHTQEPADGQRGNRACAEMLSALLVATSVWLPASSAVARASVRRSHRVIASADEPALNELIDRIAQLGRECPWTREQTPCSVTSFLMNEVAEVEEALDTAAPVTELTAELGDLLFNVLLAVEVCSRDARARGDLISLDTVAAASVGKLRRRYPQLFDGTLGSMSAEEASRAWLDGKAAEGLVQSQADPDGDADEDEVLAAEIAELDRIEKEEQEMQERERLARLVMEEIAREQAESNE